MPENSIFPPGSIDQLLVRQLPSWLKSASSDHLTAYHQALLAQQRVAERMHGVINAIPDLGDFAARRLQRALHDAGQGTVDVRTACVVINQEIIFPSAASKLYQPSLHFNSRQSLLASALHNFDESEARPSILRRAHLEDARGNRLALGFERFVSLCRQLDIGASYQAQLRQVLHPKAGRGQAEGEGRRVIERLFQDNSRTRMAVAVHEAMIKGALDERLYGALLALFGNEAGQKTSSTRLVGRQLYLLGKCIVGAVAVEVRLKADDRLLSVVAWLPDDPERLVHCHASWQQLYEDLAQRLRRPSYRAYFSRFINADEGVEFVGTLARLLAQAAPGRGVELDGRNLPIASTLFANTGERMIAKIFADARYLAVPTGDEDLRSRHVRLQGMLSAALDLLGWAGLLVPAIGSVMLVVCAAQLLDEVYEGYQDWRLGDREGALSHLFAITEVVALGAVTAGSLGALGVLRRIPTVDALVPTVRQGQLRLARASELAHIESHAPSLMRGLAEDEFALLLDKDVEALQLAAGFKPEQIRRLRVEFGSAPARLLDLYERFAAHQRFPDLTGNLLEQEVTRHQPAPSADQALLIKAFEGLTPRSAQEIINQCGSAQLTSLQATGRIPLSMAERARWYLHDSRLDKACLGIRLKQAITEDTERLVLGLIEHKAPWPSSVRVELRAGSREGRVLFATGDSEATRVQLIVRSPQGYLLSETASGTLGGEGESLLKVVQRGLGEEQKAAMGNVRLSVPQLQEWLLAAAASDRQQAARIIGMKPVATGLQPPRRFADGRLGYTLSGGGESSQQAIRRGIQQIFSTMSELQLDAYLQAVRESGINLWDHYLSLQQQLEALRRSLDEWQSAWRTPADAIRRRRVADTLRRSWRRKLVDVNDDSELVLDGEHIGSLPALPEGVDFAHVRRLTLRDMGLTSIDADFLRRFPNIVELDLSGNRLTSIPSGIEQLVQLRRLDLSRNQLAIDIEGNQRLAQLVLLDACELSFNPLMQAPDLSGLRHVRHLYLRATGQVDIPQLLERTSWRALIDLRDNRIWELQQEVQGLSQRLSQMELHDNPLDEPSRQHLERARGSNPQGAQGRPSHRHAEVNDQVRGSWTESENAGLRAYREATWDRLREEPGASDLFRFLADFVRSDDFSEHPGHFRRRIWRILDACEQSEVLRQQVFAEANQPAACEDRSLLMLGQMELAVLVQRGITDVPPNMMEARLLQLGRQLYRLDQIDSIAARHIEQMRRSGVRLLDEVEMRLFYRIQLARDLQLPVTLDDMHYPGFANVTPNDLQVALGQVLQQETQTAILDSLAQRPFWQRYVRQRYAERFEALAAPFHQRLEESERQAERGPEQAHLDRSNALMRELDLAEQQLYRTLALEAWLRTAR